MKDININICDECSFKVLNIKFPKSLHAPTYPI